MVMATTGDRILRWTVHQDPSTPRAVTLSWSDDGATWHPVTVNPAWDPAVTVDKLMVQGDRLVVFGVRNTVPVGTQGVAASPWVAASGTLR
jgi:hypothetical protein